MKFNLLSRAAVAALAAGGAAASGDDKDAGPAPGEGGTDKPAEPKPEDKPADPPAQPEAEQAVVAAADAQALIAEADAKGFARANARMTTVFASDEGKANPSLAAFMLANSTAEAPAIIDQLKAQGPAQAPEAATPATQPIANTGVDIGVDPKALTEGQGAEAEANDSWDKTLAGHAAAHAPLIPAIAPAAAGGVTTMPAITRTGF